METKSLIRKMGIVFFLVFALGSVELYAASSCDAEEEDDCQTAEITTAEILERTSESAADCLEYKVVGICVFVKCIGPICDYDYSAKVDHYLPDLVVTAQHTRHANPWTLIREIYDPIVNAVGEGIFEALTDFELFSGEANAAGEDVAGIRLRETDVVGNPALYLYDQYDDYFLKSGASAYTMHYQSTLDAFSWREPILEMFFPSNWTSLIPGVNEIGNYPSYTWGSLSLRGGFVTNPNNTKANAVVANRAAHIATSGFQVHLKNAATGCSNDDCTAPGAAAPGASKTKWQRLLPEPANMCTDEIHTGNSPDWAKPKQHNSAAWTVWREYRGCLPGEGAFVFAIDV